MANAVVLKQLIKRYGRFTAVHPFDLTIEEGEFVTLLGPSGCGKTTTLRMIAGLEDVTGGDITIGGRRINDVPIHKRNLGIVFQNYALFPHKNVFDNVAFGLKYRQLSKAQIKEKVDKALERVRLPQMAHRFPSQLSGGQQQRIALARAIVIEPDVLLLDEPLSALDANLRENMRVELKRIQKELGVTSIFVTHDQAEALAMSDKVVIMSDGHVEQIGTPEEVYNQPNCEFVATFLGLSNVMDGKVIAITDKQTTVELIHDNQPLLTIQVDTKANDNFEMNEAVRVVLRAEHLHLNSLNSDDGKSDNNELASHFTAIIDAVDYQGQVARYFIKKGNCVFEALSTINRQPFREGEEVSVTLYSHESIILAKH